MLTWPADLRLPALLLIILAVSGAGPNAADAGVTVTFANGNGFTRNFGGHPSAVQLAGSIAGTDLNIGMTPGGSSSTSTTANLNVAGLGIVSNVGSTSLVEQGESFVFNFSDSSGSRFALDRATLTLFAYNDAFDLFVDDAFFGNYVGDDGSVPNSTHFSGAIGRKFEFRVDNRGGGNGVRFAELQVSLVSVPEPSSFVLAASTSAALLSWYWLRRRSIGHPRPNR